MKGECQGRKALRQRETERNSKYKGPGAAISPAASQAKAPLLWADSPGLGPDCRQPIRPPCPLCQALVQGTACAQSHQASPGGTCFWRNSRKAGAGDEREDRVREHGN